MVQENVASAKVLPCQLPLKEINPRNFTLPCTIESLNFYAMADLGASVNVIPNSMFEHLKLDQLKKTDMLVEMADMTKKSPIEIVGKVLVKIDKFLFPSDFVEQGQSCKKPRKLKFDINLPNTHFCKPVQQILKGELKFWPTSNPNIKECNGGFEIYGMDEKRVLKKWYCYYDDERKRINGGGLSFPEFLLVKYRETQEKELIWDDRFEE
ncbi:phospholipase-like protein [Tanacetum coccineum]